MCCCSSRSTDEQIIAMVKEQAGGSWDGGCLPHARHLFGDLPARLPNFDETAWWMGRTKIG